MDTLPGTRMLSVRAQYGFMIAHRPTMHNLQQKHMKGMELELVIPTNGCNDWEQPLLLPSYSVAYQYLDPGNQEMLGNGHALTARMMFPLNNTKRIKTYITSGFGIGYIEKPYDKLENYKNVAIGSHINAVVCFSYRAYIKTGKHSRIDAGISFTHFSNGSFRSPNLGINLPALQIGYNRYFGKELVCQYHESDPVNKKPQTKIALCGGMKGLQSAYGLNFYGVTSLSGSRQFIISHKSRFDAGADLFYDRTLPWKLNNLYNEGLKENVAFRSGIHAGYEFIAGRIAMLIQTGVYIIDNYDEDGILYTKVGVDYNFTKRMFACFHLKTHYAKADYFEYGLGYKF